MATIVKRVLHQFQYKNTTLLLRTIMAIFAVCTLGSTSLLFASCSTQNINVNPSPSPGIWKVVQSVNPGAAQNTLNAVAATSNNDAWAVGSLKKSHFDIQGSKALIEHWNGTSWAIVASPNPINGGQFSAITALSATNIWAVGYGDNLRHIRIEHWNGKAWAVVQSPNPGSGANYLTGLTAISTNDIWAVGTFFNGIGTIASGEELIEHWNGTSWSVAQSANPGVQGNFLSSIAAVSTNDVWASGSSSLSASGSGSQGTSTLLEHWNGTSWSTVASPNPGTAEDALSSVVAISTRDVWAVGSSSSTFSGQQAQPLIEHWNGTSWSTLTSPGIGTNNTSLAGAGLVPHSTNVWAVGTGFSNANLGSVSSPNATQPSNETPITSQTLIEICCS